MYNVQVRLQSFYTLSCELGLYYATHHKMSLTKK